MVQKGVFFKRGGVSRPKAGGATRCNWWGSSTPRGTPWVQNGRNISRKFFRSNHILAYFTHTKWSVRVRATCHGRVPQWVPLGCIIDPLAFDGFFDKIWTQRFFEKLRVTWFGGPSPFPLAPTGMVAPRGGADHPGPPLAPRKDPPSDPLPWDTTDRMVKT